MAYIPRNSYGQEGYQDERGRQQQAQVGRYQPQSASQAPVASPPQQAYQPRRMRQQTPESSADVYARQMGWQQIQGPRPAWQRALGRLARVLGILARVCAIALALLVVANAFLTGSARQVLMGITLEAQKFLLPAVSGILVYSTPFGGSLRGDFIVMSVILFVVDWLLQKLAFSLGRWEGGLL